MTNKPVPRIETRGEPDASLLEIRRAVEGIAATDLNRADELLRDLVDQATAAWHQHEMDREEQALDDALDDAFDEIQGEVEGDEKS